MPDDRDPSLAFRGTVAGGAIKDRGTISDTGDAAPGAQTSPPLVFANTDLTGTTIDRYRVLGRIGQGGMGVVYAAFDPALDRKVALKMLPQLAIEHHAAREARSRLEARLRREAQALAKLDHPNVIGVFDVGFTQDNVFLTMQLVEGTTLDDYIHTTKPSPRTILALFAAAGRGLAAAHAAGLIHRDVKPSNILVDRTGHPYIGDFGLARSADEIDPASSMQPGLLSETMTRMGALLGTPRYMSPEQLNGDPATARSDQYSFCVSVWETLFGQHPFVADRWAPEIAMPAMVTDKIREPASRSVPAGAVKALMRGMRADPAARWPTMVELVDEIAPRSKRGWLYGGGAIVGMGVAVTVTAVLMHEPQRAKADCGTVVDAMAAIWPARRADIVAKYNEGLAGAIDDYADRWKTTRIEACQDNAVAAAPCLDAELQMFGEIVDELRTGKPGFVSKVKTVLPSLEVCSSPAQASVPPIPEGAVAKVADVRMQTWRVYRARATGDIAAARKLATAAVDAARTLDYKPALAEALVAQAELLAQLSDSAAGPTAEEAAEVAASVFYDRIAARAYSIALLEAVGHADVSRLDTLLKVARPIAMRTKDPLTLATFDHAGAYAYRALGRFDDAEHACKDALDQSARLDESRRDQTRDEAYGCYAETFAQRGNGPEALKWVDKWIDLVDQRYGKDRLGTLQANRTKVTVLQLQQDYEAAIAQNRKVLSISQVNFGGDHISMVSDLFVHAKLLRSSGRVPGALGAAKRALALVDAEKDKDPRMQILAEETLAETLAMGGDRPGMYEHYETALAIAERSLTENDDHLASIRYHIGLELSKDNTFDRAAELLSKAMTAWQHVRSPKQYFAETELGMLRASQDRCKDATPMFSHVIAGAQPSATRLRAQGGLASCLIAAGDLKRGRELFETVVRDGPKVPGGAEFAAIAKAWLEQNP